MGYLLAQFWFPALVSLLLGTAIGWLSVRDEPMRWRAGWVPYGVSLFGLGLLVALTGLLPGRLGLWLELALLLTTAYIAGCFLGGWLRTMLGTRRSEAVVAAVPPTIPLAAAPPEPAAPPVPESAPVAAAVDPPAEAEAGTRPAGRDAPRDGKPDDLRRIRGIGRQNAERLNALGIWHFYQIAAWTPQEAAWIGTELAFPGRIEREDWVGQAKLLASGHETEFSRRVDAGQVETSLETSMETSLAAQPASQEKPAPRRKRKGGA